MTKPVLHTMRRMLQNVIASFLLLLTELF